MVTHRDKKPYECPRTECGKSYCDMRSLRRHVENQHGSPPGGSTPGSMPHLTPFGGYKSDMNSNQSFYQSTYKEEYMNPADIPRPSSAPHVHEVNNRKPISKRRRSNSVDEGSANWQVEAQMKGMEMGRNFPLPNSFSRLSRSPQHTTIPEHPADRDIHGHSKDARHFSDYARTAMENMRYPTSSISQDPLDVMNALVSRSVPSSLMMSSYSSRANMASSEHPGIPNASELHRLKYQSQGNTAPNMLMAERRSAFEQPVSKSMGIESEPKKNPLSGYNSSMFGLPGAYLEPRFPWSQPNLPPQTTSPSQPNMPFLLNIRNPYQSGSFPDNRSSYRGFERPQEKTISQGAPPNEAPYEKNHIENMMHKASHQTSALLRYHDSLTKERHSSITPEQLYMRSQAASFPNSTFPSLPTPTNVTAIAVAAAKEQGLLRSAFGNRDGGNRDGYYGIQPTSAQWQSVS